MVQIFTDGAATGNPGQAAIGIVIKDNDKKTTMHFSHFIGIKDTHQAEFMAVIYALKLAKTHQFSTIILYSDSKTVVDSFDKGYIKNIDYRPLLNEIITLSSTFELCFIKWLSRQQNTAADNLAKQALKTQHYDKQIKALEIT